ncbi:MAG: acyl-CoA dehydrogenase family protein [Planctomycetes bacterium]|nr:acyl-CoA dehydrogenase family protein [Planctomycetota bacterium]
MTPLVNNDLAERIRKAADPESSGQWPTERLQCLRDAGVFRWGLPVEFGGLQTSTPQLLDGYIELARLCLTTAFILTQRDAACHRIANSENGELRRRLLPDHCAGRAMATVGISHLSTSRQHWSRPSVVAHPTATGFELTGEAPWVTGAGHVELLVTGATLENGKQILVALPANRDGIRVGTPLKLLALNESRTGSVVLDRVAVDTTEVILGPTSQVMKVGQTGGTGSFTTTAVALGVARSTLDGLQSESTSRSPRSWRHFPASRPGCVRNC